MISKCAFVPLCIFAFVRLRVSVSVCVLAHAHVYLRVCLRGPMLGRNLLI